MAVLELGQLVREEFEGCSKWASTERRRVGGGGLGVSERAAFPRLWQTGFVQVLTRPERQQLKMVKSRRWSMADGGGSGVGDGINRPARRLTCWGDDWSLWEPGTMSSEIQVCAGTAAQRKSKASNIDRKGSRAMVKQ